MPLVSPVFNLLRLCWRKSRLPQNRIYQIPDLDIIGGLCAFQHGLKHCKKCLVTFLFWRTQVLMSCHGRRVKTQPWNTKKKFWQLQSHLQFRSQWRASCGRTTVWSSSSSAGGVLSGQCGSASPVTILFLSAAGHYLSRHIGGMPGNLSRPTLLVICNSLQRPSWNPRRTPEVVPGWNSSSTLNQDGSKGQEKGPGANPKKTLHFLLLICFIYICMTKEACTEVLAMAWQWETWLWRILPSMVSEDFGIAFAQEIGKIIK